MGRDEEIWNWKRIRKMVRNGDLTLRGLNNYLETRCVISNDEIECVTDTFEYFQ
jgi:hypothetical protein